MSIQSSFLKQRQKNKILLERHYSVEVQNAEYAARLLDSNPSSTTYCVASSKSFNFCFLVYKIEITALTT